MARNTLKLDTKGFERMLIKLEGLGGDVNKAVEDALKPAAERIQMDTHLALSQQYLPAQGRYWTGQTSEAVVSDTFIHWEGQTAWVPVGFDFSEPGAGGYLITGTPKMQPDKKLHEMYKQKKYMNQIQKDMQDVVWKHLEKAYVRN